MPHEPLKQMIAKVKLGDVENIEGQAARKYFTTLFGSDFRRDRDSGGINSLLNYGYIILRSAMARAVMGAGLHPTIGIHHKNYLNPMRLVDDLIEPFRAMVDLKVYGLNKQGKTELTSEIKSIWSVFCIWKCIRKKVFPMLGFVCKIGCFFSEVL